MAHVQAVTVVYCFETNRNRARLQAKTNNSSVLFATRQSSGQVVLFLIIYPHISCLSPLFFPRCMLQWIIERFTTLSSFRLTRSWTALNRLCGSTAPCTDRDVISFNNQGQLFHITSGGEIRSLKSCHDEHDSVKETGEKREKPWKFDSEIEMKIQLSDRRRADFHTRVYRNCFQIRIYEMVQFLNTKAKM